MKTSALQFDLMVTFMEQHGDLSKPSSNARGRMTSINKWEELTSLLNGDGSGATNTTEKWRKVWSDYKNNTKKKAARLHKAAIGTGGGPAVYAKLSDLEHRVLNLIGEQVATGLAVEEAGLSQGIRIQPDVSLAEGIPMATLPPQQLEECSQHWLSQPAASPLPPSQARSSLQNDNAEGVERLQLQWNEPGPSRLPHITPPPTQSEARPAASPQAFVEIEVDHMGILASPRPPSQVGVAQPEPIVSEQTTPRHSRPTRARGTPRRRLRPTHTQQATQYFLQADENWRQFRIQQHRDCTDLRREQNRLREMEEQTRREWHALGLRVVALLDKLVNKYCKD